VRDRPPDVQPHNIGIPSDRLNGVRGIRPRGPTDSTARSDGFGRRPGSSTAGRANHYHRPGVLRVPLAPSLLAAQELLRASDVVAFESESPPPDHRIAYGDDPLQFGRLRLPEGAGPHPVVAFIHGGCWLSAYDIGHVGPLVGRRTRTIPPALRRALDARDRGCHFPDHSPAASGARGLRFTDAHHVKHWADGGETSLGNCLLLCRHHHRLVHEGGWRVEWCGEGRPVFYGPDGRMEYDGRWRAPEL